MARGAQREKASSAATLTLLEVNVNTGSSQAKSRSGSCSGLPTSSSKMVSLHSYSLSQRELESFKLREAGPMANTALE